MDDFESIAGTNQGVNDVTVYPDFKYIKGFSLLNFQNSDEYYFESKNDEIGLLILEGVCDITINDKKHRDLGKRENVFSGIPTGVYIPIDSECSIKGNNVTVAICRSKCSTKTEPAVIHPDSVKKINAGKDNWNRDVRIIIGPDSPSVNMILGETLNPPGNWSGIPPAKHEKSNLPDESLHEELYYFKTDKPQGWGIEHLYSPERNVNELIYLQDNTVTFMPWGYHQIVAAPGYTLYYLFFLAGEGNKLAQFEDPEHNWIKNV